MARVTWLPATSTRATLPVPVLMSMAAWPAASRLLPGWVAFSISEIMLSVTCTLVTPAVR
ncbi:hypothetical protein D3C81_1841870 [compost metagenome]